MDGMGMWWGCLSIPCRVFLVTTSHKTPILAEVGEPVKVSARPSKAMSVIFDHAQEGREHPQPFELYRERDSGGEHEGGEKNGQ